MFFGETERQGYYLFEFETILAVKSKKSNHFCPFKQIPFEGLEKIGRQKVALES